MLGRQELFKKAGLKIFGIGHGGDVRIASGGENHLDGSYDFVSDGPEKPPACHLIFSPD